MLRNEKVLIHSPCPPCSKNESSESESKEPKTSTAPCPPCKENESSESKEPKTESIESIEMIKKAFATLDVNGSSIAFFLCRYGYLNLLKKAIAWLFSNGAEISVVQSFLNKSGSTSYGPSYKPLIAADLNGHSEIVKLLIEQGGELIWDSTAYYRNNGLYHLAQLREVIQKSANCQTSDRAGGRTHLGQLRVLP